MATVQDIVKQVEQENLQNVAARSVVNPNTVVTGGTVGSLPGIASNTPIQNQAITYTGAPQPVSSPVPRYSASGALLGQEPAPNVDYGRNAAGEAISASGGTAATGSGPMDEQAIREQVRSQAQRQIDAINAAYDAIVGEQRQVNEGRTGSVRSINARSGLLGSDFGAANTAKQEQANLKAIAAINAERGLKLSSIFGEINQLAEAKIKAQKEEALGKANALKDQLAANAEKAKEYAKTIGASGLSLEDLKTQHPNEYKKLVENSGMSDLELSLTLNAAKKPTEQIQWKTDVKGKNIILYGVNPATGQLEYHTQELPKDVAPNEVKVIDGELWSIGADGKTATKIGGSGKPKATRMIGKVLYEQQEDGTWRPATIGTRNPGTPTPTPRRTTVIPKDLSAADKAAINQALSAAKGGDGFVSPDDYAAAKQDWIDRGGTPTSFDTKMKGYRNPENSYYLVGK